MCDLKLHSNTHSFIDVKNENIVSVYSTREKGDISTRRKIISTDYRISIDLSNAEWDCFKDMVKDATDNLEKNYLYLKKVIKKHKVVLGYIDFPLYSRLGGKKRIANQNDFISVDLIKISAKLGIGINMSIYDKDFFKRK